MGTKHGTEDIPMTTVTPRMAEAGADVILGEKGVADFGVFFSAPDLAAKVYRAMDTLRASSRNRASRRNPARSKRRRGTT
jgi:hypothetical protein